MHFFQGRCFFRSCLVSSTKSEREWEMRWELFFSRGDHLFGSLEYKSLLIENWERREKRDERREREEREERERERLVRFRPCLYTTVLPRSSDRPLHETLNAKNPISTKERIRFHGVWCVLVMPSRIIIIIIRAGELHLHFSLLDQKLVNRAADFSSAGCFLASSLETLGESFISYTTFINTHRGAIIVRKGCRRVLLSSSGGLLSSSGGLLFLLAFFSPPHPGWMPEFYWASCSGFLFFPVGFFIFCSDSEENFAFFSSFFWKFYNVNGFSIQNFGLKLEFFWCFSVKFVTRIADCRRYRRMPPFSLTRFRWSRGPWGPIFAIRVSCFWGKIHGFAAWTAPGLDLLRFAVSPRVLHQKTCPDLWHSLFLFVKTGANYWTIVHWNHKSETFLFST